MPNAPTWNPLRWWRDWWWRLSTVERVVAIIIFVAAVTVVMISPALSEPARSIQLIVPIDVVALTQVVFSGIAACGGMFATIYSLLAAARSKRAEAASTANAAVISKVKDTVDLVERNTNSLTTQIAAAARLAGMHEGETRGRAAGQDTARTLAEGQRQGVEAERASVAASATVVAPAADVLSAHKEQPIPVADDRTATATERTATASERVADAAERTADKAK